MSCWRGSRSGSAPGRRSAGAGDQPGRRVEGGGQPAAGGLWHRGPHRAGLSPGGRPGRPDGAGDPPVSDGPLPGLAVLSGDRLHQLLPEAGGPRRRAPRHGGGGRLPERRPGPHGPLLPVPAGEGGLPLGAAAAPAAAPGPPGGHGMAAVAVARAVERVSGAQVGSSGPTTWCWGAKSSAAS